MSNWFRNGTSVDSIAIDDRAVQYGDGVFETVAIREGRPRLWDLHMRRLRHACTQLDLAMPPEGILAHDLERALARASMNTHHCTAKILISAGSGVRGYRRRPDTESIVLIGVFEAAPLDRCAYHEGVRTIRCKTRISAQPKLAGIKTLNRLDQVLASAEWDAVDIFEGLMLDADENLICGTKTNVFVVHDNRIQTPSLQQSGVAGIMRQHIIDLLADNGIDCAKTDVSPADLRSADEVFLSNSQIGVVPVRRCDDQVLSVGEATRSVMAMLAYKQVPECRL